MIEPREERRNFFLGVANGSIFAGGEAFVDPSTVLPAVLSQLTRSNALIGLAASFSDLGWMLPQIFVAPWASRQPRQMPLYRTLAIVRGACLFAVAAAAWILRGHPTALLAAFFLFYAVYNLGGGTSAIAFMELVGRTVRPERLGAYFARRLFWGGIFGALAGLIVRQVLRLEDAGTRLAILFALSGVACSYALAMFAMVREPVGAASPTAATPLGLLRQGLHWMRHEAAFRRLFIARATQSVWMSASPFITLFAANQLGGGGRAVGTLLVSRLAGYVLSNLAWQRLSRRAGNRAILRVSTGMACALLFASAVLTWASPWKAGLISASVALLGLEAIAALGGAAQSGLSVGFAAVVLENSPEGQRQAFVSLMNAFLAPTMLLPMLGGFVVDMLNAPVLFLLCGVASAAGYRAASRMPERAAKAFH
jgi:MFS family permease